MSIPDYQSVMKPLLTFLKENLQEHRMQDVVEAMIKHFNLSNEERDEMLPSGQQAVIDNRVGWARTYLKKTGLLEDPKRGYVKISQRGIDVISQDPSEINVKFLNQFKEFQEFRKKRNKQLKDSNIDIVSNGSDSP